MSEEITQHLPNNALQLILARLDSIDARLDSMDLRLNSMETRLDSMDVRLNSMDVRLDSMDARLTSLEEKVDRRLQETRPIWEQVLVRLDAVEAELSETRAEIKSGLRRVERQIDILNHNILDLRTDVDELDERVTKLESEPTQ